MFGAELAVSSSSWVTSLSSCSSGAGVSVLWILGVAVCGLVYSSSSLLLWRWGLVALAPLGAFVDYLWCYADVFMLLMAVVFPAGLPHHVALFGTPCSCSSLWRFWCGTFCSSLSLWISCCSSRLEGSSSVWLILLRVLYGEWRLVFIGSCILVDMFLVIDVGCCCGYVPW